MQSKLRVQARSILKALSGRDLDNLCRTMGHLSLMPPLLEIRDLTIAFGATKAVEGVNLRIAEDEGLGVVGASGSGKSAPVLLSRYTLEPRIYTRGKAIGQRGGGVTVMRSARMGAAMLLFLASFCGAQTAAHKKAAPPPKPEPTEADLVEYIRGQLLSLSPSDGINDNLDVRFDETNKILTVTTPAGHCDMFIGALDANYAVWDVFDPSDSDRQREKLVRLTMVSVSGKTARTCYDKQDHVDATLIGNRARLLFSEPKADDVPDFHDKMTKAMKMLIVLDGGAPEKDIF